MNPIAIIRDPARKARMRGDLLGGTVAALIAVPYGMALSLAIGLRPEAGLYTSIIGGAISGVLTRAPIVVSGLSATVVPVLAMLVKTHGVGAALAAGALSGLIMILIGALRLGRFFNYLPKSVINAFTSGLGIIIAVSQLKQIFGLKPQAAGFDLGVIDDIWVVARSLGAVDGRTTIVSLLSIAAIFVFPKLLPKFNTYLPAPLIAVVLATIGVHLFGWHLVEVGALPTTFPTPSVYALDFSSFSAILYPAFTLAGLITINQLLTVVVTDRLKEEAGEVRFNRELVAQGVGNMLCPFFGAPPGVAMLARTVASQRAGASTRWSVFAHSAVLVLFLLPLRDLISQIPIAVLGAVTVATGLQLVGLDKFRELPRLNRLDAALFLLTFGLVVFSDLIVGVGVGSLAAMLLFVERAAQSTQLESVSPAPVVQEFASRSDAPLGASPDASEDAISATNLESEVQIFRVTGPLFFASSERVLTQISRQATAKTLVLDLTEAGPNDSAATDCLRRIAERQRNRGGELHLIGLDQRLFDSIERDGLLKDVHSIIRRDETGSSQRSLSRTYAKAGAALISAPKPINLSQTGGK